MDSFRQLLGAEGCSSSESGWTMYIASAMEEDDARCSNNYNEEYEEFYGGNKKEMQRMKIDHAESDDSMASDASSGPVHGTLMASKKEKKDRGSKFSSQKNVPTKQDKKRVERKSNRK